MSRRIVLRSMLILISVIYIIFGALTFWPDAYWLFETFSNLRMLWVWAGVLATVILALSSTRIMAGAVAFCAAFHAVAAFDVDVPMATASNAERHLRVTTVNINHNIDPEKLLSILRMEQPDVLVMIEDFPEARREIAQALGGLPYHAETGIDLRAVSIDSRFPLDEIVAESQDFTAHILSAHMRVPTSDGSSEFFLVATHPNAPISPGLADQRRTALEYLAQRTSSVALPTIVAGDFNLSPHSSWFARLLVNGRLLDTAIEKTPSATWLKGVPGVGLRLDHVLVSSEVQVVGHRVSKPFGSDHRAVTVDLFLPMSK